MSKRSKKKEPVTAEPRKEKAGMLYSLLPYVLICALGSLIYFKAIFFDFTFLDDNNLILDNFYFIRHIVNILAAFGSDVFRLLSGGDIYYRPIMTVSLMLDAQISGTNPFFYHVTNILIHLVSSCLVFIILNKLKCKREISFVFSVIFAVHPVLSQAVAWIPGRNDSLMAVFAMLAFIFFMVHLEKKDPGSLVLHLLFMFLGVLTKETAMLMAGLCVFYAYFINKEKIAYLRRAVVAAGWGAIVIIYFILRSGALQHPIKMTLSDAWLSFLNNFPGIIQYLGKVFLPFNLAVMPLLRDTTFVYGFIALFLLVVLLLFSKNKRANYIVFGLLWFLLLLSPSFIRPDPSAVSELFEHRIYLPIIGLFIMLAEVDLIKTLDLSKLPQKIAVAFVVAGLSCLTFTHLDVFSARIKFWESAAQTAPHSPLAHRNLGAMYFLDGRLELAVPEYRRAIELNPNEPMVHNNLGLVYMKRGSFKEAEAEFKREIEVDPMYDTAYFNLGLLYFSRGKITDAETAWKRTLELNPEYLDAYKNLAILYYDQRRMNEAARNVEELKKRGVEVPPATLKALDLD